MPAGRSADAAAALEAGGLPCMTRLLTRMGAGGGCGGGNTGAALLPPEDFPGFQHCWREVLLHGPLGQVVELVAAAGRRRRLAAEELRRAAVAGDRAGRRGGRSVAFLGKVAHWMSTFTSDRLLQALLLRFISVRLGEVGGGTGGNVQDGAAAAALLVSYAAVELLPVLCRSVRVCIEGVGKGEGPRRRGGAAGAAEALGSLASDSVTCAVVALDYALLLLARYCLEAAEAERQGGQADCAGGSAGMAEGRGNGASGCCAPWRQLLLRDVQLMELLGVGLALLASGDVGNWVVRRNGRMVFAADVLSDNLACTLHLAAAAFPAEFRAAAGGADAAASGGFGGAASGSGLACISVEDANVQLGTGHDNSVLARVVRGWDPTPGKVWQLAREQWCGRGMRRGQLEARLRLLMPPAEAREVAVPAGPASG